MAKKVVATLRNTSGVKYAKLIRSKKSDKTGAYQFKEEIVIEDHVKDILAGKDQAELIEEMRSKQDKQAPKEEAKEEVKVEEKPAEAPKEEAKAEEKPAKTPKEEAKAEEKPAETPKEEAKEVKAEEKPAETPKEEDNSN